MADKFVKMVKEGEESIEVNPSVVEDHKRLGWKVDESASKEPAEKPKGSKPAEKPKE